MSQKITIRTQILSGNLGDGWRDNEETANAYAEFQQEQFRTILAENGYKADFEFECDVQRASGAARPLRVDVECESPVEYEKAYGDRAGDREPPRRPREPHLERLLRV